MLPLPDLRELLSTPRAGSCVSIYLPTHRQHPDNQQDPDSFRVVHLQRSMPELAIVASSFHVKPLLRIVQSADRFQVLCVNRRNVQLFEGNRDALDELRTRAWQVMEPVYLERLAGLAERFGTARTSQLGDDRLPQVAEAAAAGRVGVVLLEAQRHVPGRLDATTGAAQADVLSHPEVDDMLDDLAELVLRNGGEVVIAPAERMPSTTGLAAIYRY